MKTASLNFVALTLLAALTVQAQDKEIKRPATFMHTAGEWELAKKAASPGQELLDAIDEAIRPDDYSVKGITETSELIGIIKYVSKDKIDKKLEFRRNFSAEKLADASFLLDALIMERSRREKHGENPEELDAMIANVQRLRLALIGFAIDEMNQSTHPYRTTVIRPAQQAFIDAENALRGQMQNINLLVMKNFALRSAISQYRSKYFNQQSSHSGKKHADGEVFSNRPRPVPMPHHEGRNTGKTPGIGGKSTGVIMGITLEGEAVKIKPESTVIEKGVAAVMLKSMLKKKEKREKLPESAAPHAAPVDSIDPLPPPSFDEEFQD